VDLHRTARSRSHMIAIKPLMSLSGPLFALKHESREDLTTQALQERREQGDSSRGNTLRLIMCNPSGDPFPLTCYNYDLTSGARSGGRSAIRFGEC
jgi:hypothetical protein